jgi:hypothetical protein
MSQYYFLWIQSEAARDHSILIISGFLLAQISGYYLLSTLLQNKTLGQARAALVILSVLCDLLVGVAIGGSLQ